MWGNHMILLLQHPEQQICPYVYDVTGMLTQPYPSKLFAILSYPKPERNPECQNMIITCTEVHEKVHIF
jgi:hypothetical protein